LRAYNDHIVNKERQMLKPNMPVEAIILLCPPHMMADIYFTRDESKMASLVKANLINYEKVTVILDAESKYGPYEDEEAIAEECFDLTNNPSRQDERVQAYGRRRSVSVGDVVDLGNNLFGGGQWLCAPNGWIKLGEGA
jgi:hypothetical protein